MTRANTTRVADDTLLDATRTCVLTVGVRRTTLAEVARTASVSRMTIYRRFPDVRSLLAALMRREFGALLDVAMHGAATQPNARGRLVAAVVESTHRLSADPVMRVLLDVDAELLLPYLVQRLGSTQRTALGLLRSLVAAGHQDGSIRQGDAESQARALLLVSQSFVFSLRTTVTGEAGVTDEKLLGELRTILEQSLLPLDGAQPG